MLKKNIIIIIFGLIISNLSYSNNKLGVLKINSTRYEPFDATITINDTKDNGFKLVKAQLGTVVDFYRHDIEPSYLHSSLSFSIKEKNNNRKVIQVTSDLPIPAEKFGFVIRLYDEDKKHFGIYNFITPIVDHMEGIDMLVCNFLHWDKNKECTKLLNNMLVEDKKTIDDKSNKIHAKVLPDKIMGFNIRNLIDKKNISANKKELTVNKEEKKLKPKKNISSVEKIEKPSSAKIKTIAPIQGKEKKVNQLKKNTPLMKKNIKSLRQQLKPHMYQNKRETSYPRFNNSTETRDILKPKITVKKKEDIIRQGSIKFSEIMKTIPPEKKNSH
ncbi:MAG: hypothetical protein PUP46_02085 [Endozoicomonas sp. (ex Botrylloides leachii)]|nr:hypothetical protein [Endozoicomonas sp. (ex Botrylloides leachii)]